MTATKSPTEDAGVTDGFRHEALFYEGALGFVDGTASFIRDGIAAGESILVVVGAAKIQMLREELGDEADAVHFADMNNVGLNPARIIPTWRDFVKAAGSGRHFRGIGEPIWAARTPDELVECERHESLLNVAFDGSPPWWLLCPYDTESLDPAVLDEAHRTHPFVWKNGEHAPSAGYYGLREIERPFEESLPEPPSVLFARSFDVRELNEVRLIAAEYATAFGLSDERASDLILAVDEIATNSVRHAGGAGSLRIWGTDHTLICEVRDKGRIEAPLVGRVRPSVDQESGFGLWLANQLCDLVQIRTFDSGSIVRLHMARV